MPEFLPLSPDSRVASAPSGGSAPALRSRRKGRRGWAVLAKRVLASNLGRLTLPYRLNFIITKECHSRCVNCRIWETAPQGELNLDEIARLAKTSSYLSWINFSGGEPSDRPDFPEAVGHFVRSSPDLQLLHFPTNGLRPEHIAATAEKILSFDPPSLVVTVSVDGPPKEHDRLRGIPGNFERAVETYQNLQRVPGVEAYFGMTLFATNHSKIRETIEELRGRIPGFDLSQFHVNLAHRSGHYYSNTIISRTVIPEMRQSLEDYRALRRAEHQRRSWKSRLRSYPIEWIEDRFHSLAQHYLTTHQTPLDCAALMASCFLDEKGVLYPCSIWGEPVGSIRDVDYDLKKLLASDRAHELRQKIRAKQCAHCWTPCEAYQTIAAQVLHSHSPTRIESLPAR